MLEKRVRVEGETAKVLNHPYPYSCALAISNDCDYYTKASFEAIHLYLNTTSLTPFGRGLGLPISDSVFMYSERKDGLSYFSDLKGSFSRTREMLREAMKEGWIDTMHGYGDFIRSGIFSRALAEKALNELERENIKIKIWTDHGSSDNTQNLSQFDIAARGDKKNHRAYHADLLKAYGILFVSSLTTDIIGQDGTKKFHSNYHYQKGLRFRFIKRLHGSLIGKQLINPKQLRDNHTFYSFCRARCGVLRPDVFSLKWQLSKEHIQWLIESGGNMILYQHLGAAGRGRSSPPHFDRAAIEVFNDIADQYRRGVIWVARTVDILVYAMVSKNITVTCTIQGDSTLVEITANGIAKEFGLSGLKNISFRIPIPKKDEIRIKYGNYRFDENEYHIFHDNGFVVKMKPKYEGCKPR
jgi:hypothetical protein